jgi:hypothetical protein
VINDVTTTIVARGALLFVIMAWITIHFGRNPRNGGRTPKDSKYVNIITFISAASLFVIIVWLINDVADSLIAIHFDCRHNNVAEIALWKPKQVSLVVCHNHNCDIFWKRSFVFDDNKHSYGKHTFLHDKVYIRSQESQNSALNMQKLYSSQRWGEVYYTRIRSSAGRDNKHPAALHGIFCVVLILRREKGRDNNFMKCLYGRKS